MKEIKEEIAKMSFDLPDTKLGFKEYGAGFKDCRHRCFKALHKLQARIITNLTK